MDMTFTLPGGSRVEGQVGPFTIATDQPPDASAPTPFTLFLASIGACAAYYVEAFCRQRGIATDNIRVGERTHASSTGMVDRVDLSIELPSDFPSHYRSAVIRSAEQCTVKKHLEHPPAIGIEATIREEAALLPTS